MRALDFYRKYAAPGVLFIYRDRNREHCYTHEVVANWCTDYDRDIEGRDNIKECEIYRNAPAGTMREWCIDNEIPMVDHENEQFAGSVVLPATQAQKFLIKLRWL